MIKRLLGISLGILSFFTLVACNKDNSDEQGKTVIGDNISVLNQKSHIFKDSADLNNSATLTLYKAKDYGDVPYLNANDISSLLTTFSGVNFKYSKDGNVVTITKNENDNCFVKFDSKNNEISYKNIGILTELKNDSIGQDYCLTSGTVIRSAKSTKIGTVGKNEGKVSLNDYKIKLYEEKENIYVPYDLINVLLQPSSLVPYVYNGKDFFLNPTSYEHSDLSSLCYSGNGVFTYGFKSYGETYVYTYKKVDTKSGQKYTYQTVDVDGKVSEPNHEIALYSDGTGVILDANTNVEIKDSENKITKIKYKEENNYLTMYMSFAEKNSTISPTEDVYDRKLVINTDETRVGKKERSKEVAEFTYNLLCLSFDKVYSVKEAKNIASFDKFLTEKGYKNDLQSTNVRTYEEAMFKFLNKDIDDGHTNVEFISIFDIPGNGLMNVFGPKYPKTHTISINDKAQNYYSERYNSDSNVARTMRTEETEDTAYLSFDSFLLNYGFPNNFKTYAIDPDIEELKKNDTCGYLAACIMEIESLNKTREKKIKNIVVDITANTGGAMGVMPFVACIMTKDPTFSVVDSRTGQVIEYHYEADFDGDGVYGDTYADKFNFFILTSDASFSCGSALPSMLKGTNVKILGIPGAGGASPITCFTDASGFGYKTSGQFGVCYKDNGTYKTIENGVPVDYEISKNLWYDYPNLTKKIDEIVASLNK